MPEKFLIENKLAESNTVKKIINPYKNETAYEVYSASAEHFNQSANYLVNTFEKYRKLPSYKRAELLYKTTQKITEQKEHLAKTITNETGKPIKLSRVEVDRAVLTFRLGAEEATKLHGEILPLDLLPGSENKTGIVRRFPLGLILGITPWNFPVNLVAHKVSPALASGNVIMIKPSSNSVVCAIELGKIILEACNELGLDYCPVNVLPLSGKDMDAHVSDARIKLVSFTGSSDVGWKLKQKVNRQRVGLELGGNAGVIIDEVEDTGKTAVKILMGGFAAAGQSCISVQRVYINEKIYDALCKSLIDEAKKIKFGNPYDEDTVVGPMITEEEAIRAESWVNEARNNGAAILTGGKRNGAVLEPAIIENASNNLNVKCSEVFAPVITIEKYSSFEKAVDEINNSRFGLQAGIFTNDMRKIMYAYDNIHTGGVIINDVSAYRMDSMPYGGTKDSGNTREGVAYAIKEMTEEKILVL
ncbi:MAG: aldehyde dehydrogenase family protein [Ignavibacteriae bacterium]|nr:MAG: aldehyde dehydrogenase family protein [Ignavibacteriota bacterium]